MIPTIQELKDRITLQFHNNGFPKAGELNTPETLLVSLLAQQQYEEYVKLDRQLMKADPSNAVGMQLDEAGEFRGIPRRTAQVAIDITRSNVYFFLEDGANVPVTVARDTNIATNTGITYLTTQAVTITATGYANRVYVNVKAGGEGPNFNVTGASLVNHSVPNAQLRVNNFLPIETGSSSETDEEYRPRVLQSDAINRGGNYPALEAQIRGIPNVADLSITPMKYGIGTVGIFVESTNPITGPALLAQVQAEAEIAVDSGTRVFVEWPEHLFFQAEPELVLQTGYTVPGVQDAVKAAMTAYINGLKRGQTLVYNQLVNKITSVTGVIDVSFRSMERGIYDLGKQNVTYLQKISPSNLGATSLQKWVTSADRLNVCAAGAN
jgi:uncharacterized phage protein gp47/JayE